MILPYSMGNIITTSDISCLRRTTLLFFTGLSKLLVDFAKLTMKGLRHTEFAKSDAVD
jgi:hypothetical protein